jgi:hypothetical protein
VIPEPCLAIYWITNEENNSHPRFGGLFNDRDQVLKVLKTRKLSLKAILIPPRITFRPEK